MTSLLLIVTVLCVAAMVAGRSRPGGRPLVLVGAGMLVYIVSIIVWWLALYFQVVTFDPLLAKFGIYRTEGVLGLLLYLGPPILPVVTFLFCWGGRSGRPRS